MALGVARPARAAKHSEGDPKRRHALRWPPSRSLVDGFSVGSVMNESRQSRDWGVSEGGLSGKGQAHTGSDGAKVALTFSRSLLTEPRRQRSIINYERPSPPQSVLLEFLAPTEKEWNISNLVSFSIVFIGQRSCRVASALARYPPPLPSSHSPSVRLWPRSSAFHTIPCLDLRAPGAYFRTQYICPGISFRSLDVLFADIMECCVAAYLLARHSHPHPRSANQNVPFSGQ